MLNRLSMSSFYSAFTIRSLSDVLSFEPLLQAMYQNPSKESKLCNRKVGNILQSLTIQRPINTRNHASLHLLMLCLVKCRVQK